MPSAFSSLLTSFGLLLALTALFPPLARAQTCSSNDELDQPVKAALDGAARQYFDMSTRGDVAGLKANSIPAVAKDFSGIEQAVVTNKAFLAAAKPTITGTYLLDASQAKATIPRADFYCGIYNSPDRIGFFIPNLPPGRYAIVTQNVEGKDPITLTMILQDVGGNAWKLAGYYPRLGSLAGHNADWYISKARDYKTKGQKYNAWLYYLTGWDLTAPVSFMSTPQLDKLSEEMQTVRPGDLPTNGNPLQLPANGKVFSVIEITAVAVEDNLDLRVRYNTADASNSGAAFQDNMAVIKAIVAKYPEFRDAFSAVVARAVDNNGHDYGSVLAMKDIK